MRVVLRTPVDDVLLLGRPLRAYAEELPLPATEATVVLDPRCPLLPSVFVADLVERVGRTGRPHVGVRPVTDTVKEVGADGVVGRTVDRDALVQVVGPLVLPLGVEPAPAGDEELVDLVLTAGTAVVQVEAPAAARRVEDASDVALLEGLALEIR